jgi:UDP-N-acetylglucosamine 4-epimerase
MSVLSTVPRAGDIPHSSASIDKAKLLGYEPEFSKGLEEAVDWYWKNLR